MRIQDNSDLLSYLIAQASERKDWFGFTQQRITAIALAHEIARNHADTISPEKAVDYAKALNEAVYQKIIREPR